MTPTAATRSGIDPSLFSPTIRPGNDFFRYVNGPWLETHKIPDDQSSDGHFYRLHELTEDRVKAIIEEAPPGGQIANLYTSFMDEERCDALGTSPLAADLTFIEAADSPEDLARVLGELERSGVAGIIGREVWADSGDPDSMVLYMGQGGIGLPDESFYREDQHAETRAKYISHIDQMADLAKDSLGTHTFSGKGILALETTLASHHWDIVKSREVDLTYNPTTLSKLESSAPGFPWRVWADALHLPEEGHDKLVTQQPSFFEALGHEWLEQPLETWREWLRWRVVLSRAPFLTTEISRTNFNFYGTVLTGAPTQRARWKRGVGLVNGALSELVGSVYVTRHFPPGNKARMDELVANLIEAYRRSITSIDWMMDATRVKALDKLDQFVPKVGYPNKWRDYSGLTLDPESLVGNVRRSSAFEEDWGWGRLTKPTDREEWFIGPQVINAFYNPNGNEIVFPAAILQPPFFDADVDDAANYGAIGSIIGHEIGHGFDDQGSKFDGRGRLSEWWTDEDRAAFTERTKALITQFDAYSPAQLGPEHRVNGALTIGENIGDLAGLEIGLKAYAIACGGSVDDAPILHGFTGLQRYFLSYAAAEQTKRRDEALITQINSDPHAPEEFRINGVIRNIDAWYEAFEVGPDDALWLDPEGRVSIW
ncbi:MAG: peptidase M13 [Demequinaceae bacterium]|nr:peptidase M13 [Demequinaceae bacterium]